MPPGYVYLKSYQQAEVIYDLTVQFCNRFIDKKSRTHDQMVQAARSGKQNIAEGYMEKSLKDYIKLLGFSRASLHELLLDYQDFARYHQIIIREKLEQRIKRDQYGFHILPLDPTHPQNPVIPVNTVVNLIKPTAFLLDRQISSLEQKFIAEGGFTESLYNKRRSYRHY